MYGVYTMNKVFAKGNMHIFAFTELKKMHVQPNTESEGNSSSLEEGEMILLRGSWIATIKPQAPHIAQNKHNNMLCGSPAPFKGFLWPAWMEQYIALMSPLEEHFLGQF